MSCVIGVERLRIQFKHTTDKSWEHVVLENRVIVGVVPGVSDRTHCKLLEFFNAF